MENNCKSAQRSMYVLLNLLCFFLPFTITIFVWIDAITKTWLFSVLGLFILVVCACYCVVVVIDRKREKEIREGSVFFLLGTSLVLLIFMFFSLTAA